LTFNQGVDGSIPSGLTTPRDCVRDPGRVAALAAAQGRLGAGAQLEGRLLGSTMLDATAVGLLAATLTTVAFVPQVVKTWRTRSTADISLGMFLILTAGIAAWLIYGAIIGDLPLILANAITLVLAGTILVLKIKNG
jgi:MtN3 and saliva related transmembrane protein